MNLHPMVRHAVHHGICQAVYRQTKGEPPASTIFDQEGIMTLANRVPRPLAQRLSAFATQILNTTGQSRGIARSPETIPFAIDDANTPIVIPEEMKPLFRDLLPLVFTPDVERTLEAYYKSFFRINHCSLYRTHPVANPKVSFCWHRDHASMGQVHIMLYLTDSGDESGATEFLNLADSRRLAEVGYSFVNPDERVDMLDPYVKPGDPPLQPIRPKLIAGDGVLFAASRCLHRGRVPTKGFRDVFLIMLMPGTAPWRVEMDDFGVEIVSSDREAYLSNPFVRGNQPINYDEDGKPHLRAPPPPTWARLGQFGPS
jgi:hypothetical protein